MYSKNCFVINIRLCKSQKFAPVAWFLDTSWLLNLYFFILPKSANYDVPGEQNLLSKLWYDYVNIEALIF